MSINKMNMPDTGLRGQGKNMEPQKICENEASFGMKVKTGN